MRSGTKMSSYKRSAELDCIHRLQQQTAIEAIHSQQIQPRQRFMQQARIHNNTCSVCVHVHWWWSQTEGLLWWPCAMRQVHTTEKTGLVTGWPNRAMDVLRCPITSGLKEYKRGVGATRSQIGCVQAKLVSDEPRSLTGHTKARTDCLTHDVDKATFIEHPSDWTLSVCLSVCLSVSLCAFMCAHTHLCIHGYIFKHAFWLCLSFILNTESFWTFSCLRGLQACKKQTVEKCTNFHQPRSTHRTC